MQHTIDLSFVEDEKLQRILRDYLEQAIRSYEAKTYLGCLVACGAVTEGVLTWALLRNRDAAMKAPKAQKDDQNKVLPVERWNLTNLIKVAFDLQLLGETADKASWAVKDFRNFVHPYNVLNRSARADEALATSAISAVQEIVRSLRGRLNP